MLNYNHTKKTKTPNIKNWTKDCWLWWVKICECWYWCAVLCVCVCEVEWTGASTSDVWLTSFWRHDRLNGLLTVVERISGGQTEHVVDSAFCRGKHRCKIISMFETKNRIFFAMGNADKTSQTNGIDTAANIDYNNNSAVKTGCLQYVESVIVIWIWVRQPQKTVEITNWANNDIDSLWYKLTICIMHINDIIIINNDIIKDEHNVPSHPRASYIRTLNKYW